MKPAGWTRESWAKAQINRRCSELERDLASFMHDASLSLRQRAVLCGMAVHAAGDDLAEFDWFREESL